MQEIQHVLETYLQARVAGDSDLWLSLWDPDGIQLFPGAPAHSLEQLKMHTAQRFKDVPVAAATLNTANITVVGDHAFAHGTFMVERRVDGVSIPFDGKFLSVLKQQPDGRWKLLRDCSNGNTH